jgi:hypothetical protein
MTKAKRSPGSFRTFVVNLTPPPTASPIDTTDLDPEECSTEKEIKERIDL